MLQYKEIDVSEGIDVNKTSAPKECMPRHFGTSKMLDLGLNDMLVTNVMTY